jgi:hypothetical protein
MDCDEPAVVESVRDCKTSLLGISELVEARVASFVSSVVLRGEIRVVVWGEMGSFSVFLIFWGKSVIFSHVSRAGEVVEGAGKLVEVTDGAGEEKPMILDEISLVEPLFVPFLYSGCSGSCDMPVVATSDVGFVWTEADTVAVVGGSVWVLVSAVLDFGASLALKPSTIPSNPFFATVYPSSRPKSIPLATPSSNRSPISLPKFCSTKFHPFSYPSL